MSRQIAIATCVRCGHRLARYTRLSICLDCRQKNAARTARPVIHSAYIAGYVPPKGSIAAWFAGRILPIYH